MASIVLPTPGGPISSTLAFSCDEPQGRELFDEPAVQRRLGVEVELLERLVLREAREAQAPVEPALLGRRDLDRQQIGKEPRVAGLGGLGQLERAGELLGDG